jgi:hypothetical protein
MRRNELGHCTNQLRAPGAKYGQHRHLYENKLPTWTERERRMEASLSRKSAESCGMSTKSRQVIYGSRIQGAEISAKSPLVFVVDQKDAKTGAGLSGANVGCWP